MKNQILLTLRGQKSRASVAKDLRITPQGLGLIERGERIPRPILMKRIADYYGKTVDEIFFDDK
ncbi:helix-turn-helix transcriptional regulator [Sporomusa aerivorans]|uniref:helix-turn-helix transcriptional regulator n=1 Tax=Sporomusa aerivorans TaxID=204936 RepID=UPI00352AFCEF